MEQLSFGQLLVDWLNESKVREKYQISELFEHTDVQSIDCVCHPFSFSSNKIDYNMRYYAPQGRHLGVIITGTTEVRLFPFFDPQKVSTPFDKTTWIVLYGADPDFFHKFEVGLEEAHVRRFGPQTV